MSKVTREFCPASRYHYDFGVCSAQNGFAQIDTTQDAEYFGTWANPFKLILFCYCEGDCITTECENEADFIREVRENQAWNVKMGFSWSIDAYLPENIERWKQLGFTEVG